MDLRERRQLDAARHRVDKVRTRARPWKSIAAQVLAVIMAAVSRSARTDSASAAFAATPFWGLGAHRDRANRRRRRRLAFCLLASAATAGLAGKARHVLEAKVGIAHAAVVRYAVVLLGGLATALVTLQLFGIGVTQLLLGGAFATVVLGIAAQQSMSNVFAGMVLLLARPVDVGQGVSIKSGPLGGDIHGQVAEIGITYVRLDTPEGPLQLPNSQVLAAAVAPATSPPKDVAHHQNQLAGSVRGCAAAPLRPWSHWAACGQGAS